MEEQSVGRVPLHGHLRRLFSLPAASTARLDIRHSLPGLYPLPSP